MLFVLLGKGEAVEFDPSAQNNETGAASGEDCTPNKPLIQERNSNPNE